LAARIRSGEHLGRSVENGACRAVAALQAHDLRAGIVFEEAVKEGDIGAAEAVNGLVGVADGAHVAAWRGQAAQQAVL